MGKSPDRRYRLRTSGAPPWMATLGDLVAEAFVGARSGFQGPIVLEALDDDGRVLWCAWHSSQASFEARIVELVSEGPRPGQRAP